MQKTDLKNVNRALGVTIGKELDGLDRITAVNSDPRPSVKGYFAMSESGKKGRRQRIGESHANAKLTDAQVDAIRDERETKGTKYADLAKAYGVSKSTIAGIVTYRKRSSTLGGWKKPGAPTCDL